MYHVKTVNQLFGSILTIIVFFGIFSYYDLYLKKPLKLKEGIITDIYIIPKHEFYIEKNDSLIIIPTKYYVAIKNIVDSDTIYNEDIEISKSEFYKYRFGDKFIIK